MISHLPPRPPSLTLFCALLAAVSFFNLVFGLYQMNGTLHESKGVDLLLTVFTGPALAVVCTLFMLRGRNWARLLFWLVYTPFAIWIVIEYPSTPAVLRIFACAIGLIITPLPEAHWFFTGRDYLQRRREREGRRRSRRPTASETGQRPTDYHY